MSCRTCHCEMRPVVPTVAWCPTCGTLSEGRDDNSTTTTQPLVVDELLTLDERMRRLASLVHAWYEVVEKLKRI